MDERTENVARGWIFGFMKIMGIVLAATSTACAAATPVARPSQPLITGEPTWPEDIMHEAERAERACNKREAQLRFDYEEGKKEQDKFKTIMGSVTGGVGTVSGAISGVGAYVIKSPDTMKTVTGITGFVGAGLGAAGSLVTIFVQPGAKQLKSSSESLASIEQKRAAARAVLEQKDPGSWSEEEKAAWEKAAKDLEDLCK
jgi:hypothetical protein